MQERTPIHIGIGLATAGFVVIGLGWFGAARLDYTTGQVPYLISGGLGGLGLVAAGLTLLVIWEIRRLREEIVAQGAREAVAAPAVPQETSNGGLTVVAGRHSYHRPDCRLVHEREDLTRLTAPAAAAEGLSPCRVCAPDDDAPPASRERSPGRGRDHGARGRGTGRRPSPAR